MRRALASLILLYGLGLPATAIAQQTGSISGIVVQPSGSPIAGVTLSVTGVPMPAPRTTSTSELGRYRFDLLLPGEYSIDVAAPGVATVSRTVRVLVARDVEADFVIGRVTEHTTVSASPPVVDVRSTEVSANYTRERFETLPLERSYIGLTQLAAGIADNSAFAPSGGGSRQDNTFLMDGVNITNPLFGYLSTEVNELDIEEVNVKRGAISAAFGRSAGFVVNAVSKSGSNVFQGTYRFDAGPDGWSASSSKSVRDRVGEWAHAVGAGGPIAPNRLFFYGSARVFRGRTAGRLNLSGPLPDRVERTGEYFGKITAQLTPRQFINVGYRRRPSDVAYAAIGSTDAPSVATNTQGTNRVVNVNYDYAIGTHTTASVKYVHMDEENDAVPVNDLGVSPPFTASNLMAMGRVVVDGIASGGASLRLNRQDYSRDEIKAIVTEFRDLGPTSHAFEAGIGFDRGGEVLERMSNAWGDISTVTVNGQARIRTSYYPDQPPQISTGRTWSLFVQDGIAVRRLSIDAGVLFTRDDFIQDIAHLAADPANPLLRTGTFLTFGFRDEVQPRLGAAYQLRKGRGDKLYGHWGRYYGLDQKSSARALASGRLYLENADFDPVTGALVAVAAQSNTTPKNIVPGLRAPYMDETVAGYSAPLPHDWTLDAFYLYRTSQQFIEDDPAVLPFAAFQYRNDPSAARRYRTFTVEARRPLRDGWAMNASYAWSRMDGTYDQDYSGGLTGVAVFNTSSLIDDGPGAFTDDRFRNGVLSQDRTHVYKVLATWMPPRVEHLTAGVYVRGQSGTPWEARGLPWGSSTTYLNLLEPAGSRRNPFWTNVDLNLTYTVQLGDRRAVRFEGRVLNLFNRETVLLVDNRQTLAPRSLTLAGTPVPDCRSCYTDAYTSAQPTTPVNPAFGRPIEYAPPRRFQLAVSLDF